MIYTLENTIEAGNPVEHVYDANGLEWFNTLEVDTETGRIVKYKDYPGVKPGHWCIERDEIGHPIREEIYIAAPVLVIFKEQRM